MLTQTLGRLFALAEAYPNLKANENFLALQGELANTEDKIALLAAVLQQRRADATTHATQSSRRTSSPAWRTFKPRSTSRPSEPNAAGQVRF